MALVERRSLTDEHKRMPVDLGNVPENLEGRVAENPALLQAVVAELRESEERYRAVVEQVAEGILLVDVDSKRVLEANAAYQGLLGYSPEEVLRLSLYDLVPYLRESMDCYVRRVRERGSYVSGERRHRRKDGSLVDVEVRANVISYGGREAMCMLIRDVTERRRAEEERARLAAMVESSDDAIIGKTLGGIITSWNKGAKRLYGYSAHEAVGQSIFMLVPPESPDEIPGILQRIRRGEKVDHFETVCVTKDGRRLDISLTVSADQGLRGQHHRCLDDRPRHHRTQAGREGFARERGALPGHLRTGRRWRLPCCAGRQLD